jgi:hypothetical protein
MPRKIRIGHVRAVRMSGDTGSYAMTGQAASLLRGLKVDAAQGSYALTGQAAAFSSSGSSLTTIGPETPEQISMFLPVADSVPYTATATCEYKRSADSVWITGHPLHRIRNDFSGGAFGDTLLHGFAWPIIDLAQGTSYDVRVTLGNGASGTHTLTTTTRSLPAASGAANKTANSDATIRTQLAGLVAGDVLEIAAGTHTLTSAYLTISGRTGTALAPIVIRGASRTGTILTRSNIESMFLIENSQHIILENMTIQGCGINNGGVTTGPNPSSDAVYVGGTAWSSSYITVRNCIFTGTDRFFYSTSKTTGALIYDNTVTGNNTWTVGAPNLNTDNAWGDDGIHLPGEGNCAFQNTLTGFGDTFAYCSGDAQGQQVANAVHFYRNEVRNSLDDSVEVDDAEACCTFYDNRFHNCNNAGSLDALCGGPFLFARNIFINLWKGRPHKWNSQNSGQFLYNNTVITPESGSGVLNPDPDARAAWYQPGNGAQYSFGYRNNVHIYTGAASKTVEHGSGGYNPVDWTHNSWYPDRTFEFTGYTNGANLAAVKAAIAGGAARTPVFSGVTEFMYQDSISAANPWVTAVSLPATSATATSDTYLPTPASGSALKNSGVAIPNITDDFTGAAPDRGAVIEGRAAVTYGDQTGVIPTWVPSTAWHWTSIPDSIWTDYMKSDGTGIAPAINSGVDPGPTWAYTAQWDFSGPTYSRANHEVYMFGGGHSGTTINAVSRWNLQESPSVTLVSAPTTVAIRNAYLQAETWRTTLYHTDGKPHSPHSYFNNQFSDATGEFYSFGISACATGYPVASGGSAGSLDIAAVSRSGVWRAENYYSDVPVTLTTLARGPRLMSDDGSTIYYWDGNDASDTSTLRKWVIATNTHSIVGASVIPFYSGQADGGSGTALVMGGADSAAGWQAKFVTLATGATVNVTVSGDTLPSGLGLFDVTWCGSRGYYLAMWVNSAALFGGATVTTIRIATITPTSGTTATASVRTMTGTAPTMTRGWGGVYYDPTFDSVVVVPDHSQALKIFKVA